MVNSANGKSPTVRAGRYVYLPEWWNGKDTPALGAGAFNGV